MEQRLAELLAQWYGIPLADAKAYVESSRAEGLSDENLEFIVGLYEIAVAQGDFPSAEAQAEFEALDAGVQTEIAAIASAPTASRRQQLRQRFDEFVESSFQGELNAEERALLDQVYADAFSLFNASGRADEDFQQFIDDSFNRLVAQASMEQQDALADEQQRAQQQLEDAWRGRALRILQGSGLPPELILPALDDAITALEGVQASGQDVNLGDGSAAFAAANALFTNTVLDVVDQYTTAVQGQQAAAGELPPPAPPVAGGPPAPTAANTVTPGTQAAAFVQQQTTGLTPEEQALQQANLDPNFDTSTEFGKFASGLDPAFAATLNEEQLRAEFQRQEKAKADQFASVHALQLGAVSQMGGQVPSAGIYAPSSFTTFLEQKVPTFEAEWQTRKKAEAQRIAQEEQSRAENLRLASKRPLRTEFV